MPTLGLRHLSLKTGDLEKTIQFYTEVLGLKIAFRVPPKRVFLKTGDEDDLLDFVKTTEKIPASHGLDHLGFRVTSKSLKQIEKRLNEHHVKIEGRRGKSNLYFRDPNGYVVEFYCD